MDDRAAPSPDTLTGLHRRASGIVNARGPVTATVLPPDGLRLILNAAALGRPDKYQQAVLTSLAGFKGARVEIDLSALPFIDSAFCSWMIQIAQQIQPARVVAMNAGPRVQDILKHLGMNKVIDVRA